MCGIYGYWLREGGGVEAGALERMGACLRHRGPDAEGSVSVRAVGGRGAEAGSGGNEPFEGSGPVLGHRRLSIIDTGARANQPFATADGRYTIVYNGEIYNYVELREELSRAGRRFRTDSDTEVLLEGYAVWGRGVLERALGMFALAVWDAAEENLLLARDATGMKPLYFARLGGGAGGFAFASELKALAFVPGVRFAVNEGAIREYLGAGFIWRGHTSIAGVERLPPGHRLEVRGGRAGEAEAWWRPDVRLDGTSRVGLGRARGRNDRAGAGPTLDEAADELHEILREVVRQHLRSDVPTGLLLSGGLDSSILAAMAARELRERGPREAGRAENGAAGHGSASPLRTVTMGFEGSPQDEREHARAVAGFIGSEHREVMIDPERAAAALFENAHHFDDLFGDSGTIPAFAAFAACRDLGLKVVLVGEGADEVFGGYPQFRRLTGATRAGTAATRRRMREVFRSYTRQRYGGCRREFGELLDGLRERAGGDWFQTIRLFELLVQLPVSLNLKVDHASMASSLEARSPFQDRRVVEFALSLPRAYFVNETEGKLILRRMARRHRLLPEGVIDRRKMGTPVPWEWLRGGSPFARRAKALLTRERSWARGLGHARLAEAFIEGREWGFPGRYLRRFDRHANLGWLVMNLLVLEAWAGSSIFEETDDVAADGAACGASAAREQAAVG